MTEWAHNANGAINAYSTPVLVKKIVATGSIKIQC
jgi:hypothetical protein